MADCLSLSADPPHSDITTQFMGVDLVVDTANAGGDFTWLASRDILVVKEKLSQVGTVSDAPGDTLVILPLRVAAEIALAGEAAREKLAHATALNLSCGLVRPERRRKSPRPMTAYPIAHAQVGAKLVERGYSAIPIIPASKRPGHFFNGEWRGMHDWQARYSTRLPTHFEIDHWSGMPDAGVCVVTGQLIAVDIDVDDRDIIASIEGCLPPTPAIKVGAKGKTLFFRGDCASLSFNEYLPDGTRGRRLCDLIGPGRQTVIPPTVHPDTGQPYRWIGQRALQDLDFDELPELEVDVSSAIAEALKPFGYKPEIEHPALNGECRTDADNPFRALNNAALANLDAWVPKLGLARCRRPATAMSLWPNGGHRIAVGLSKSVA